MDESLLNELQIYFATPEAPGLGCGPRERVTAADVLNDELSGLCRERSVPPAREELLRALVLLWHDHLDATHRIVQEIDECDGSFLHAMMHRREGDYWNSKYWFRRAGKHPITDDLSIQAGSVLQPLGRPDLLKTLLPNGKWDPAGFVDQCQQAATLETTAPHYQLLCSLQKLEFEHILQHLCR